MTASGEKLFSLSYVNIHKPKISNTLCSLEELYNQNK